MALPTILSFLCLAQRQRPVWLGRMRIRPGWGRVSAPSQLDRVGLRPGALSALPACGPAFAAGVPGVWWLVCFVASVFNDVTMEQVLDHLRGYERLAAGSALHAAKRVTAAEAAYRGARGIVRDGGREYQVWVGVRQWLLVGECECSDADPLVSSPGHLAAVAAGLAETAGPCAHAVAVHLS